MTAVLRAICFDLDDTLWPVRPVLQRAEGRMLEYLRTTHPVLAASFNVEDFMAQRLALAREHPDRAHHMTWLRTTALRAWVSSHGHDPAIGDAAFAVFSAARNDVNLFPDVVPALQRLASRYLLATFSNGNADIKQIDIPVTFKVIMNAESVGIAKPHAQSFKAVAYALELDPAQILYVGDDPHIDIAGARSAGCVTAWINRIGSLWPVSAGVVADFEISDLMSLADVLDQHDDFT